ncbi:MAG: hypothetical protein ABFD89_07715 [Bryobacteraceae bacterium]
MKSIGLWVIVGIGLLTGCNRGIESKEAVRQAVIDHLADKAGMNVSSMQIDVASVSFRKDEADATVLFRAKGGGGSQSMTMNYTLERKGNRWVVKGRSESGMPHGAMGGGAQGQQMPPGHPAMGGGKPSGPSK